MLNYLLLNLFFELLKQTTNQKIITRIWEDDADLEILPLKKVRKALERSCRADYQYDGEMKKRVVDLDKLYKVSLFKQKKQSFITHFLKLWQYLGHIKQV